MMTNPTGRITQGQFSFLPDLTDDEIRLQVAYGLKKGYAWSVEYTDDPHPRNTGVTRGWGAYGCVAALGLDRFGESAPGPEVFRHFGLTPEALAALVRRHAKPA